MTRRALLLSLAASALLCGAWLSSVYLSQLNNTIALQRCARMLEAQRAREGRLPSTVSCLDYWGSAVKYYRHGDTYLLVSSGRDQRDDARYEQLAPPSPARGSTCLDSGKDTVLVGGTVVQGCAK